MVDNEYVLLGVAACQCVCTHSSLSTPYTKLAYHIESTRLACSHRLLLRAASYSGMSTLAGPAPVATRLCGSQGPLTKALMASSSAIQRGSEAASCLRVTISWGTVATPCQAL